MGDHRVTAPTQNLESALLDQRIALARAVVGSNPAGNRNLFLERPCDFERRHVSPLRAKGPDAQSLVDTLTAPDPVKAAIAGYRLADAEAMDEQSLYRRKSRRVEWPLTAALVLAVALAVLRPQDVISAIEFAMSLMNRAAEAAGAAPGYPGTRLPAPWADAIKWFWYLLPFVVFVLLAMNIYRQWSCSALTNYDNWKTARATAEAFRREIFRRIMAEPLPPHEAAKAPALLLRLEYFRRWQCEVQQAYFVRQRQAHRRNLRAEHRYKTAYWFAAAALFLFMLVSSVSTLDEQGARSFMPVWLAAALSRLSPIEGFGLDIVLIFAIILAGAMWHYRSVNARLENSLRQAARFHIMQQNFADILGDRLQQTRLAAAAGNERAVREYMARVHSMMSLELNDWVRLADLDRGNERATFQPAEAAVDDDGEARSWQGPLSAQPARTSF
jgi:hypothetical protein